ncbi:hypothetical protein [Kitasatospora sp. McL0602]|uniref:hypothetical protein n=1 Tax=Kitasatospora sp. McL0602 TaxID=3439530 RepID=UPI003F8C1823
MAAQYAGTPIGLAVLALVAAARPPPLPLPLRLRTHPFAATSPGAVIRRIVDTGPGPTAMATLQALDPALAATVAHALTMDPASRPADGAALLDLLTAHPGPLAVNDQITQSWHSLHVS